MDGRVYKLVDFPELPHVNCLPGDSLVLPRGKIMGVSKRWYDGKVIVFKTASNRELTCTPNHPILTDRGFVPAYMLNVGSHTICDGLSQRETFIDWNDINKPSSIQNIAESFFKSHGVATRGVPVAPIDFHGDGVGSKVAIIATDRFLMNGLDSPIEQHFLKRQFIFRIISLARILFHCLSMFALSSPRNRTTPYSIVSSLNLTPSLRSRHLIPFSLLGFALTSNMDSGEFQAVTNGIPTDLKSLGKFILRTARKVKLNNLGNRKVDIPELCVLIPNAPNAWFLDKVSHVRISTFHGYVYNLETTESYYIANGIASHNCRCGMTPAEKAPEKWRPSTTLAEAERWANGKGFYYGTKADLFKGADLSQLNQIRKEGVIFRKLDLKLANEFNRQIFLLEQKLKPRYFNRLKQSKMKFYSVNTGIEGAEGMTIQGIFDKKLRMNIGDKVLIDPTKRTTAKYFVDASLGGTIRHEICHALKHVITHPTYVELNVNLLYMKTGWLPSEYAEMNYSELWAEWVSLITKKGFKLSSIPKVAQGKANLILTGGV